MCKKYIYVTLNGSYSAAFLCILLRD